jgi:translation elongation factor EF-Ts
MIQNYYACQIKPHGLGLNERAEIEQLAAGVKNGKTNYFQMEKEKLSGPRMLQKVIKENKSIITWQTAYAGDDPIDHYEVMIDGQLAGKVEHQPQVLKSKPFVFETKKTVKDIYVAAVDKRGSRLVAKLV